MSTEAEVVVRTQSDVRKLSAKEIRRRMNDEKLNAEMQQALATPDVPAEPGEILLSQEEIDAAAEQRAADEAATAAAAKKQAEDAAAAEAAKKIADEAAAAAATKAAVYAQEDAVLGESGVRVERDANGNIVRLVQEYQSVDEAGNPIGNRTHLEARSYAELISKQTIAHKNIVSLAERLRKSKPVAPQAPSAAPVGLLTREEWNQAQADILGDDKEKVADAKKKLIQHAAASKTSNDVPQIEKIRQAEESYKFMSNHVADFYPVAANSKVMTDYLKDNNLEFNAENLEFAFLRIGHTLAPRPGVRVPAAVPNQPAAAVPAVPVVPAPAAAVPVSTPAAPSALVVPAAVPNTPAAPPRPAPNGGLEPGSMSGGRGPQTVGLTLKDVAKWSATEMKKKMADPKTAAVVRKLIADRNEAVRKAKQLA